MSLRQTLNDLSGVKTFGEANRELWNLYRALQRTGAPPGLTSSVIGIRNQIAGYICGGVNRQGEPDPTNNPETCPDGTFRPGASLPDDFRGELVNLSTWLREEGMSERADTIDPLKKRDAVDMVAGVSKRIQKATIGGAVAMVTPLLPYLVIGLGLWYFGPALAAAIGGRR